MSPYLPRRHYTVPVGLGASSHGDCDRRTLVLREPPLVINVLVRTFHVGSVAAFRLRQRPELSLWREVSLHRSLSKQVSVCRLRLAMHQQPFRRLGVRTCCHRAVCARVSKSTENVNMLVSTMTWQGH